MPQFSVKEVLADPKPLPDPVTWSAKRAVVAPKPDGAAAKALESYHVATTRYLEASQKLQEAEQRRADAEARVVSAADLLTAAQVQMREARQKLDAEIGELLSNAPTAEPRAKAGGSRRGQYTAAYERTCVVCGGQFIAKMPTARYCSGSCRARASSQRHQPDQAAEMAEVTT